MQKNIQHSETTLIGILLFFIGGFQNGYTYIARSKVFANLQTGNMILLTYNVALGNYNQILHYLIPILCFGLGVFISTIFTSHNRTRKTKLHYRSSLLLLESILVLLCGFINNDYDIIASSIISFNASMTLSLFKHFNGRNVATTMMIGNYTKVIDNFAQYIINHDIKKLKEACILLGLIFMFLIGALSAMLLYSILNIHTIWLIIPINLFIIFYMEIDQKA